MADDNSNENLLQQLLEAFKGEGLAFPQKLIDIIRGSKPEEVHERVATFLDENKEDLGSNVCSLVKDKLNEDNSKASTGDHSDSGKSEDALASNPSSRDTDKTKIDMGDVAEKAKSMLGASDDSESSDGSAVSIPHSGNEKIEPLEPITGPENHLPEDGMDAGVGGGPTDTPGAVVEPNIASTESKNEGAGSLVDDFHMDENGRMVGPGSINDDPVEPGSMISTDPTATIPENGGVGIPSSGNDEGGMVYADVMMEDGKTLGPDNIGLQQAGGPGPDVVPQAPAPDAGLLEAARNATSSAPVTLPTPAPAPVQVIPHTANEQFAAMMYKDYLGRDISQEEMTARGAQLDSGYDKNQMARDIGNSPESAAFQDRTLASGNEFEGIVKQLFVDYVGFEPDPVSIRIHSAALKNGASIDDVRQELLTAPPVQSHIASDPVTDAEINNQNTLMAQAVQAAVANGTYGNNGYKPAVAIQVDPRQQQLDNVIAGLSNQSLSDDERTKILQNAQATMGLSPTEETAIDQVWFNNMTPTGQANWNNFVKNMNGAPMTVQPVTNPHPVPVVTTPKLHGSIDPSVGAPVLHGSINPNIGLGAGLGSATPPELHGSINPNIALGAGLGKAAPSNSGSANTGVVNPLW